MHVRTLAAPTTTWRFDVAGLEETVPLGLESIAGGELVSVIGDYDGFRHSDVTSYGTIHQPQIGTTTGLAVAAQNPDLMARVGDGVIRYSSDGGNNWIQATAINGRYGHLAPRGRWHGAVACARGQHHHLPVHQLG